MAGALCAETDNNAHAWFQYVGDHAIGKSRFGAHLEGQWRRARMGRTWQQLLLRPGLNFSLHPKLTLTGGYAFIDTFRYGDFPVRARFPEHRFYEQALIRHKLAGLDWQQRLRFEQRIFRGFAQRYENRFRYQIRTDIPLRWDGRRYYVALSNEILFNYGKDVAFNVFDQNRAYVALGRNMGHQTRVEAGFLEQTIQQRSGRVYEHNHTVQLVVYCRLPFGKR